MRHALVLVLAIAAALAPPPARALLPPCNSGHVYEDVDGDGRYTRGDRPMAGVAVSDGRRLVRTDARGAWSLPVEDGRTVFVVKPAGYAFPRGADGLPVFWRHVQHAPGPPLRYGGIAPAFPTCRDFALRVDPRPAGTLDVLLIGDPQPRDAREVDYFDRGIVGALLERHGPSPAPLGLTLGDVASDDLSVFPAIQAAMARLRMPWLHLAGNHDLDFDAASDEDSLRSFRAAFGPDTFAWEEHEASFLLLDDVIYQPDRQPQYIGGLREEQFGFIQAWLASLPRTRPLVVAAHIPFFDPVPGRESFRRADRERLFALLQPFDQVLLLSAHGHVHRRHVHGPETGWQGASPLQEFNLGAACGAYWSGVADAAGIPDATMPDGTPKGWAWLRLAPGAPPVLRWRTADPALDAGMALHAPAVLRQGAYPAFGVYANVYDGHEGTRVEYRIADGDWRPMQKVGRADPRLLVQNALDDTAASLRGFDRSPEAAVSSHLWRGTLPTDLAAGEHRIEVRAYADDGHTHRAHTRYRLEVRD